MLIHWLNWNSQTNNVVVSNDFSLCVGSCPEDQMFSVGKKFDAGTPVSEIVSGSVLTLIQFKSILNLRCVRNRSNISITYQNKTAEDTLELDFSSAQKAEEFYDHVSQYVFDDLTKVVGDQSRHYGLILIACSVFLSLVFLFAFFDKHRFLAYLLPSVCVIGTLSYVTKLVTEQRKITRWTSQPNSKLLTIPAMRAIGFSAIFSVFALVVSSFFTDQYGEKALIKSAMDNSLSSSEVRPYLQRGSSIDYSDAQGRTALWWSLKHGNHSVSTALIQAGADVRINNGALLEHAIVHAADEKIISSMMDKGVLELAEVRNGFDTKYYINSSSKNFTNAYQRYRNAARINR